MMGLGDSEIRYLRDVLGAYMNYFRKNTRLSSPPLVLWIEPTNACNLRCPMCPGTYSGDGDRKGMMSMSLFRKIIDEISAYNLESKLLQRGEPLLHPHIAEMVAYMTGKGMWSEIDTNGTLLDERLSEKLISAGLQYISFSFDGYDKDTYEKIRVNATFESTIRNIRTFLGIKKNKGGKLPYVRIKSLVQDDARFTPEKKKEFIALFDGLPVDEFSVTAAWSWFDEKVVEGSTVFDFKTGKDGGKEHETRAYHPCQRLWTTVSILWNGVVVPCCMHFNEECNLGDVNSQTVLQVWNDVPMRRLREKNLARDIGDIPLCGKCQMYYTPAVAGVPKYFYGMPTFLKRVLSYDRYRKVYNLFVDRVKS